MNHKYTADNFAEDLEGGRYADGGYPKFFITSDSGCLCYSCAKKEKRTIRAAIRLDDRTGGWQVVACDINWEDPSLFCDNCNERIESAYAEDDADGARENPARPKARRNPRVARKARPNRTRKATARRSVRKNATRVRRSRRNPGFAAGAPVWARINGRLYKATVLSGSGARVRIAIIDPYSGRESIRQTSASHLRAR